MHRFDENDADDVVQEYTKYIDEVVAKQHSGYLSVMPAVRIGRLAHWKHCIKLWSVTRQVLLSPGQSFVERRFSVNKHTEAANFTGDIFFLIILLLLVGTLYLVVLFCLFVYF